MVKLVFSAASPAPEHDDQITVTFNTGKQAMRWSDRRTMSFDDLCATLSTAPVGTKDGVCFTPATFTGYVRRKDQADVIDIAVLDSDCGHTEEEVAAALQAKGWKGFIHSTFSHMTSQTDVAASAVDKWRVETGDDDAEHFLLAKKGYLPHVVRGASVVDERSGNYIFQHQPCPKFRVILPLTEPWEAGSYTSQEVANATWAKRIGALAHALGLHHDQSCTDTSRLFYTPRRRDADQPFVARMVDGTECPIWTLPDAPSGAAGDLFSRPQPPPQASVSQSPRVRVVEHGDKAFRAPDGQSINLTHWAVSHGARFEIAGALRSRKPGIFGSRQTGVKFHVECPFDDEHTTPNDRTGTFIVNASAITQAGMPSFSAGFYIGCQHNACAGRDRLDLLLGILEKGWLTVADLTNPAFLAQEAHDVAPVDSAALIANLSRKGDRSISTIDDIINSSAPISGKQNLDDLTREIYREITAAKEPRCKNALRASFPKHLLRPGGVTGMLVDYMVNSSRTPQPELALGASLTLLGALMGRRVEGPTGLRTNLYTVGVADSGAGKGHQRECVKMLLMELGQEGIIGGDKISSGAGLISRMRREQNTIYVLDEFGMFLKGAYDPRAAKHDRDVVSLFTSIYSEAGQKWMGSDYADTILKPVAPIIQPHLSIFGITNPISLWEAFGGEATRDGSLARYLMFHPTIMYPNKNREAAKTIPPALLDALRAIVSDIPDGSPTKMLNSPNTVPTPYRVTATAEAQAILDGAEDALVLQQRKYQGTARATVISRVVENTYKVACILAVADEPAQAIIRRNHVEYALALCSHSAKWVADHADKHVADGDFSKKLVRVMESITKAGDSGISGRDLTFATRSFLAGARQRAEIMADLIEARDIVCVKAPSRGGRPRDMTYAVEHATQETIFQAAQEEAARALTGGNKR